MPAYPSNLRAVLYGLEELARCLIRSRDIDWVGWFLRRLADQSLSERRRRSIDAILANTARSRGSASLARDVWINGRDLWTAGLKKPLLAVLACEAAAWLKDRNTFEDALAVGPGLIADSTRARLDFLREMYLIPPPLAKPRTMHLPSPMPHDSVLAYVDYYARARAADSEGRFEIALDYYGKALRSLPQDHEAYEFALERCNRIRNMKSGESNQPLHPDALTRAGERRR